MLNLTQRTVCHLYSLRRLENVQEMFSVTSCVERGDVVVAVSLVLNLKQFIVGSIFVANKNFS